MLPEQIWLKDGIEYYVNYIATANSTNISKWDQVEYSARIKHVIYIYEQEPILLIFRKILVDLRIPYHYIGQIVACLLCKSKLIPFPSSAMSSLSNTFFFSWTSDIKILLLVFFIILTKLYHNLTESWQQILGKNYPNQLVHSTCGPVLFWQV